MGNFETPEDLFKEGSEKLKKMSKDYGKYIPIGILVLFILFGLKGFI